MILVRISGAAKSLFGASSPLVLARLLCTVVTFGLPLVLARALSAEGFGAYKQFFLVAQTFLLIGQIGLTQSLLYFLPREGEKRGAYLLQTAAALGALGLLGGAALYAAAPALAVSLDSPALAAARLPLAIFAGAMLAAAPLEGSLISEGKLGRAAVAYVASDALRAGAMIAVALIATPYWIFTAAALAACVRVASFWTLIRRRSLPSSPPSWPALRAQLGFALPFAGASLLYVSQRHFSQYAVAASFDPATFAVFAVATFHLQVVDIVFTPMSEVLMVQLAQPSVATDPQRARACWNDAVHRLASILIPAACGALLLGSMVIPVLFTAKYLAAVPLFWLATSEIVVACLPLDALLRARGETRYLLGLNLVRLPVTAMLVIGGIAFGGLAGAIVGGVVGEAGARVAMLARGRRHLGCSTWGMLAGARLDRVLLAAAAAAAPALAISWYAPAHGGWLIALVAATYGAAYLGFRRLLGLDTVATRLPVLAHQPPLAG